MVAKYGLIIVATFQRPCSWSTWTSFLQPMDQNVSCSTMRKDHKAKVINLSAWLSVGVWLE